jgi:hypothetical protein
MASELSQLPIADLPTKSRCCNMTYVVAGLCMGIGLTVVLGITFLLGRNSISADNAETAWNGIPTSKIHPDFLAASASHGGSNMAVCTALVDESAEGFFALDYVTGDLKCWVYYHRIAAFGGMFMTNVQGMLGASKNPEYLLVSGQAASTPTGGNVRPAASLIYVVDMKSGYFAAYTVPWNRSFESSNTPQQGQMVFVSGGQIREPMGAGVKKPITPPGAGAAGAAGAKKTDPNTLDPNAPQNPVPNNPAQPANPKGKK